MTFCCLTPCYLLQLHFAHIYCTCFFSSPSVLEKSEFKDDSQFFRFYADEETEGTGTKSKQLQRNDFKLIENILAKSLVVSKNTHIHISTCSRISVWIRTLSHSDQKVKTSSFSHEKTCKATLHCSKDC